MPDAENDAATLLARLAADAMSVERICNTLRRAGLPATDHGVIRRALLAAAEECVTSPDVSAAPLAPPTINETSEDT